MCDSWPPFHVISTVSLLYIFVCSLYWSKHLNEFSILDESVNIIANQDYSRPPNNKKKNISETCIIFKIGGFFLLASKQDSIRTIYTF